MNREIDPDHILAKPYGQRQLIAVYPDSEVAAFRSGKASMPGRQSGWSAGRWARLALLPAIVSIPVELALASKNAGAGDLEILPVSDSEAKHQDFKFPVTHPRRKLLYVAHPTDRGCYYPMASFHRMTFEHKFAEVLRLLMSLGATQLTVEHEVGWSHKFAANAGIALSQDAGEGKFDTSKCASSNSSILFKATLDGTSPPSLPEDLVWYDHELLWKEIAVGRLKRKMKTFALELHYNDNFGITASLSGKAEGVGFDIGGSFEEHTATTWKISGEFG